MKILFLPSHYVLDDHEYGSEADLAYNVVNRIAMQHPDSIVVTGRENLISKPPYKVFEVMPKFRRFDMSFLASIQFNLRYTVKAFQLLRTQEFDLVHHVRPFALGSTFNLALLLGAQKKAPVAIGAFCSPYAIKGVTSPDKTPSKKDLVLRIVEKGIKPIISPLSYATLRKADVIFVVNKYTKQLVLEKVPNAKIVILPPGKEKSKYTYNPSKQFSKGKLTFLTVGDFVARKNLDKLILAFSKVASKYPDARLKLLGDGYEEPVLRKLTKKLGLENQVTFHERVPNKDAPAVYATADVYVSMPIEEAFGHVYLESMATGLPIIATDTVGTQEILGGKMFGTIIPQADINAMATNMEYLLAHPEVLPELSSQARKEFLAHYDWDVIIPRYLTAYDEILGK